MTEIFSDDPQTPVVETPPVAPTLTLPDSVAALVGEGKKYATIEKALEALPHSQEFISKLEQENRELREASTKAVSREELYATVQELLKAEATKPSGGLDEQGVKALLDRTLLEREAKRVVTENEGAFKKAMAEKYGDKAKDVYLSEVGKLGMTAEAMDALARTNPKAALKLFGIDAAPSATPRPTLPGGVNTTALATQHQQPQKPKAIMYGASTKDIVAEWNRHKTTE